VVVAGTVVEVVVVLVVVVVVGMVVDDVVDVVVDDVLDVVDEVLVVVVVVGQGFGEHVPGPRSVPDATRQSTAVSSVHVDGSPGVEGAVQH